MELFGGKDVRLNGNETYWNALNRIIPAILVEREEMELQDGPLPFFAEVPPDFPAVVADGSARFSVSKFYGQVLIGPFVQFQQLVGVQEESIPFMVDQ